MCGLTKLLMTACSISLTVITFLSPAWSHPSVFVKLVAQEALPLDSNKQSSPPIQGVDREQEPVTFGVPLHADTNVLLTEQLLLVGANDVQFRILRKWPNERIQWVLVDTLVDIKANQSLNNLFLTVGSSILKEDKLAQHIGTTIQIKTGTASFSIRKKNFNLLDAVTVSDAALLKASHQSALVLEDANGNLYRSDLDDQSTAEIEENGYVRCVVKVQGGFKSKTGQTLLAYTLRMHFYRGKSHTRLFFTLRNASKTKLEHVSFRSLALVLQSSLKQPDYVLSLHDGETKGTFSTDSSSVSLFQGENNFPSIRENGFDEKIWPTGIAGYRLRVDGQEQKKGTREQPISLFYGQVSQQGGGSITFGTRFAAGYWPQGLSATGDGALRLEVFPPNNDRLYVIRFGSHITREHLLHFAKTTDSARNAFFKFQYPVVVRPEDVDWFNQTEVWSERLVSFKDEATYFQGKQWPVDSHPLATLRRRPSWAIVRHLDLAQTRKPEAYSQASIALTNYLRQGNQDAGTYYLQAEQMAYYLADQAVFHSDDYNAFRAQDEAPGLTDASGNIKAFSLLPNAALLPSTSPLWGAASSDTPVLSMWFFLTGDQRFAEAYLDAGEFFLTRTQDAETTGGLGRALLTLSDLYDFSKNPSYATHAWNLLNTHVVQRVAQKGQSYGLDRERGFYIGKDQNNASNRQVITQTLAGPLIRGTASYLAHASLNDTQASAARDLLEAVARFVSEQMFVSYSQKLGDFGFVFAMSVDQNLGDVRNSPNWNQGLEDAYLAIVYAFLMSHDAQYLKLGEQLLQITAENPSQRPEYADLASRQTLQYLIENPLLFATWRELPLQVQNIEDGRYHLTWISPFQVQKYWFKWSERPIVPSLGYKATTGVFQHPPTQAVPFFAANFLDQQPKIVDPGLYQSMFVKVPDPQKTYYFAARFLSTDPRPAPSEPFGEQGVEESPSVEVVADAGLKESGQSHVEERGQEPAVPGGGCHCQQTDSGLWWIFMLFFLGTWIYLRNIARCAIE